MYTSLSLIVSYNKTALPSHKACEMSLSSSYHKMQLHKIYPTATYAHIYTNTYKNTTAKTPRTNVASVNR